MKELPETRKLKLFYLLLCLSTILNALQ